MNERKKVYVKSGQLQQVLMANGVMDAISSALAHSESGLTLDPWYFYLDERGFRDDDTAQYKVPVEQALAEAGYIFEDEGEGGTGVLLTSPNFDLSPAGA